MQTNAFLLPKTVQKINGFGVPERRLEFEELLCCLGGFRDVVSEHANGEELAHVPVIIHFLQGSFSSQETVQPYA